jgi:hypothetical protein
MDDTDAYMLQHGKSLSLILIEDSFHQITHLGVAHGRF